MKHVKIAFRNWWGHDGAFTAEHIFECFPYLRGHFTFELSDDPDLVLYSVYNFHAKVNELAIRLLYSGECGDWFAHGGKTDPSNLGNVDPTFFHFGIGCNHSKRDGHLFMPQGFLHLNMYNEGVTTLIQPRAPNTGEFFCNFIYSNGHSQDRRRFMEMLSQYKRVECCGAVSQNNTALVTAGGYSKQGYLAKQAFQHRCKFSIAMENNYAPGYNTEKITDPFVARSVPIYFGDTLIGATFNKKAFINIADFYDFEDAIKWIKKVDQDDALYQSYLNEPVFTDNIIPHHLSDAFALEYWKRMIP